MSRKNVALAVATVALAAVACASPTKDKPQATVSAPAPAAAPAAAPAGGTPVAYAITPANSKIEWVGAKMTLKHNGGFQQFTGRAEVTDGRIETAKVTVDIDAASITSDTERLTGHLKSPDFFDVAQFPKATFASTAVKAGAAAPANATIEGNLTIRGVTKAVSFPATVAVDGTTLKANAEFGINRKDWGIVYPGMPDDLIADQVLLKLSVAATKQ